MSIHQTIYETLHLQAEEVMSLTGAGDISGVVARRDKMKKFLSGNAWDLGRYKLYLRQNPSLPDKKTIIKNAAVAGVVAVKSGFKKVSEEEQKRRHSICIDGCEFYRASDDRCAKCGCFASFKSRLEAWHCPIDKW